MEHYLKEELYELIKTDDKIFDFIQEGSLDGLWYWDLENLENEWMNERFWLTLGYNPSNMPHLASAWKDIINQDDLTLAYDNFNKHIDNPNHPYDQEVRYTHKNGTTVWIRCRGIAIRDETGKPTRMLGAHQDITPLKRAEEKLIFLNKSINALLSINEKQRLYEYFTETIHSVYSNTIIIYVSVNETQKNVKLESISGLDKSVLGKIYRIADRKFIGKEFKLTNEHQKIFRLGRFHNYEGSLADFSANEFSSTALSLIQKLLNINQIYTIGINKNNNLLGALHIITLNETEINDKDFLETYTAYFSSVVENLNNTIKLKESEEKFRTIFEHSPIMIDAFDETGNCVLWNKECEKTLGYTIDEVNYSEDPFSLFYPDKKVRDEVIKTVVGETDKKFREWNPRTKNGGRLSSIWANFRISDKLVISIGLDISEQKKAEKKLKEQNDQFEMIIKGANLGWWDWDIPSGDEIYNDILTENLGYKITEIKPHINWWEGKIHPDDAEQVSIDLQEHFVGKIEFYQNKHRLKTKSGQWKWFLDYGKVVERDSENNPIRMIGTLRDIDYEERANEKLNTSLQQIQMINANTPNIIWKSDIDDYGKFQNTYISDAVDEFLALPKSSISNSWDKYFSYILPEYLPLIDKVFKDGIENPNKLISFEYELKRADGKPVWFSSTGRVIHENKKLTVYGSTIDITERKQAEAALHDSEIRFKALHNASFGGIAIHDKGIILECNNGLSEISGFEIDRLIGMDGLLLIAEESRNYVMENITRGHEKPYEAFGIRKNGEKYPLRLEAREIPYKGKNIRVVEFRDITEQKEAENKLKESEYKMRSMFQNTQIGILFCDTSGKILEINPVILDILGSPSIEATKKINLLTFKPLVDIGFAQSIEKCITGKQIISEDVLYKSKWGKTVFMKYYIVPVIVDDEVIGVWANLNNLTDLYAIQNQLKTAKEKAEESDRLKSAFLANMSHEIRTPMNGILGFTELLERPNLSGEQKEKYIKIIRKSGDRMLDTVNDIIDISKIDAGQIEVSNDVVNVNEEIRNNYEFFKEEAAAKKLDMRLIANVPQTGTLTIMDKNKLNSIVSNLIKNAIKYTDKGSIEIYFNKRGSELEFRINDTGIGIPEDRVHSVFNRFEQADIEDAHARQGSGLGLSITKAYVEMLGGNIGVESEQGVGSTFYFTLPWIEKLVVPEITKEKEVITNASINRNINILIAEDDDTSFEHLKIILNNVAYGISRAISGEKAVEFVKNNANINLVLMDVKMPIMDGYTATKEIRKFNKDVIIIAQTAYALSGDKEKALAAGCNDYITKPIVMELLVEMINKHLN